VFVSIQLSTRASWLWKGNGRGESRDTGDVAVTREANGTVQIFDPVERYGGYGAVAVWAVCAVGVIPQIAGAIGVPAIVALVVILEALLALLARRIRRVGVHVGQASVEVVGMRWPVRTVRIPRSEVIGVTSANLAALWMVALEMRDGSRIRCPIVMPEPLQRFGLFGDRRIEVRGQLVQALGLSDL
jgi:hypothetical protein